MIGGLFLFIKTFAENTVIADRRRCDECKHLFRQGLEIPNPVKAASTSQQVDRMVVIYAKHPKDGTHLPTPRVGPHRQCYPVVLYPDLTSPTLRDVYKSGVEFGTCGAFRSTYIFTGNVAPSTFRLVAESNQPSS